MRRTNGEGSVSFEKSRNCYRVAVYDSTGKRVFKRFKTKELAEEWLLTTRADILRGDYVPENTLTVGAWVLEYLDTYKKPKVRPSTLARYYTTLRQLEPIANIQLKDLTALAVQRFYNSLPPEKSSSDKAKVHKLLKAALKKAFALGTMKDIMAAVEAVNEKRTEIEIFELEEIHKLLDWVATSKYYQRYYLFIKLAIASGARLGELIALRTSRVYSDYIRIDLNAHATNGKIYINEPKTVNGIRNVTIPRELAAALREFAEGGEYVFHNRFGGVWNTHNVERAWRNILDYAELPHKHFHALRHTHATQLLANHVPLIEVSRRLGHSKASITLDLYGHAIPGYDKQIPEKVQSIFNFDSGHTLGTTQGKK